MLNTGNGKKFVCDSGGGEVGVDSGISVVCFGLVNGLLKNTQLRLRMLDVRINYSSIRT